MTHLVSIIIPCYNLAQYLPETLDSVLAQTYQNWEGIIVNDGSVDDTEKIAKLYLSKDKRFKYIYQKNQGVSSARNNGIRNSLGNYILPLDADDFIAPQYLEEAVKIFNQDNDIRIIHCNYQNFGEIKSKVYPKYSIKKLLTENMIVCTSFFKRKDFDNTKGYNEDMMHGIEDWDFWLTLLSSGGKVYKIPKFYFFYRIRSNSRQRSIDEKTYDLLKNQLYLNHHQLYFQVFGNPIDIYNKHYKILDSPYYFLARIINRQVRNLKSFIYTLTNNKII